MNSFIYKSKNKKLKGVTLIEMMLSSIIAIIIIAFLTSFFLNTIIGKQMYILRQELNYNVEYAIKEIAFHVKQSTNIDEINSVFVSHPGKLQLTTATTEYNPLIIQSSGNDLTLTRGGDGPYSLITNRNQLTNLSFHYLKPNNSPGIIKGSLTLESLINPSISISEDFSITLRSHTP